MSLDYTPIAVKIVNLPLKEIFTWFSEASVNYIKSSFKFIEYLFPGSQDPGGEECEETCLFLHHQDVSWLPPARAGKPWTLFK